MTSGMRTVPANQDPLVGRVIAGKYELGEVMGSGSMGKVYRAKHMGLGRTVAVKMLHGSYQNEARMVARFHREAQAASLIHHPNVVEIIDFGQEPDGGLYIVMEFLEGTNLRLLIEEQGLEPDRAAFLMAQVLSAVAAAHAKGIVHRDLKPENIVVVRQEGDDGQSLEVVKILDFGIAKINDRGASGGVMAQTVEMAAGTPEFMSPEQCSGRPLDERSDVYSCGCLLYMLLTGRVPFTSESAVGTVLKQVNEAPIPPSQCNPQLSAQFDPIVLRALQKKPEDRYPQVRQMRADLLQLAERMQLGPMPHSGPMPALSALDLNGRVAAGSASDAGLPDTLPEGSASVPLPADRLAPASSGRPMKLAIAGLFVLAAAVGVYGLMKRQVPYVQALPGSLIAQPGNEADPVMRATDPPAAALPPDIAVPADNAVTPDNLALVEAPVPRQPEPELELVVEPSEALAAVEPRRLEQKMPSAEPKTAKKGRGVPRASVKPARAAPRRARAAVRKRAPNRRARKPVRVAKARKRSRPSRAASHSKRATAKARAADSARQQAATPKTKPAPPAPAPVAQARVETTPKPAPAASPPPQVAKSPPPPPAPKRVVAPKPPTPVLDAATRIAFFSVSGPLPVSVLRRALARVEPEFDRCYSVAARRAGRDGFGDVRVAFRIGSSGRASSAEARGGRLPGLDQCVRGAAARIVSRRRPDLGEPRASFVVQFRRP